MPVSVAIIDDNNFIREYLSDIIISSDSCTLSGVACNGFEAREIIQENLTDVYLVDLGLPDEDGVNLISLIKSSCSNAQSLVISIFGDSGNITRSIRAGATGYLLKNECNSDIIKKINSLKDNIYPLSPSLMVNLFKEIEQKSTIKPQFVLSDEFIKKQGLASREVAVLNLLMEGLPIFNLADILNISTHTVNQHLRSIYRKLNVHSRSMAVRKAIQNAI